MRVTSRSTESMTSAQRCSRSRGAMNGGSNSACLRAKANFRDAQLTDEHALDFSDNSERLTAEHCALTTSAPRLMMGQEMAML